MIDDTERAATVPFTAGPLHFIVSGSVRGAEESLTIIPYIHMAGLMRGKRFSIVSIDLPNSGYSESFLHEKIATSSATRWPAAPADSGPIVTPVLDVWKALPARDFPNYDSGTWGPKESDDLLTNDTRRWINDY